MEPASPIQPKRLSPQRRRTQGWKPEIEGAFASLAAARRLPHGAGVVAFRDAAFPAFPTFPVVHQYHLHVFGELLPPELINQHGDPYLFELYRRCGRHGWGSGWGAGLGRGRPAAG